ncbi:MAG: hypothetical protein M1816_004671 [Peltula sp. TS41687]|nr:MAG: hypothetical protein M1816_004671 [Peltula sp. TS41687]
MHLLPSLTLSLLTAPLPTSTSTSSSSSSSSSIPSSIFASTSSTPSLNGSGWIFFRDFALLTTKLPFEPPFCAALTWAHLDTDRVVAVRDLAADQCGTCMKVCNPYKKRCAAVLAVDRPGTTHGGITPSFGTKKFLWSVHDTVAKATWGVIDTQFCNGIVWKGGNDPSLGTGIGWRVEPE